MHNDKFKQQVLSEQDLFNLYMCDPTRVVKHGLTDKVICFSEELAIENAPKLTIYSSSDNSVQEYDETNQAVWLMPEQYQEFDIVNFILNKCKTEEELQRVGEELLEFQKRDMFMLLRYLKYLVDTMQNNNVIWGVGRGSSVASYVLYLIGIHRINSLFYGLSIDEFLK